MFIITNRKEAEEFAEGKHGYVAIDTEWTEETPPNAPHQVGDIVFITSVDFAAGKSIPTEYINKEMIVKACYLAPVEPETEWEVEVIIKETGEDFPYLITDENVSTEKPF